MRPMGAGSLSNAAPRMGAVHRWQVGMIAVPLGVPNPWTSGLNAG